MTTVIAFWVFLLSASTTMFLTGRKQERVFVSVILMATVSTLLANAFIGIGSANKFVISIDVALWIFVLIYIARSDRYWPIWFAAFHSNTVAAELGSILFPNSLPGLYMNLAGAWALPALGAAAYGVVSDRKLITLTN